MKPDSQYDFFMSSPQKSAAPDRNPPSTTKRVIIFGGILALLVAGSVLMASLLGSAGQSSQEQVYKLMATQADLAELSSLGVNTARDANIRTLAATSELVYSSQSASSSSLLGSAKLDKKRFALLRNTQFKQTLKEAQTSGKFDAVFQALLTQRADEYRNQLQTVYANQKSQKTKTLLADQYQSVLLLTKRE